MHTPPPYAITTIDIISLTAFTISLIILSCLYHRRHSRSLPIAVPEIDTKPPLSLSSVLEFQKPQEDASDSESGGGLEIDFGDIPSPRRWEGDIDCLGPWTGSDSPGIVVSNEGAEFQGIVEVMAHAEMGNFGSMQVKGIGDVVQGGGEGEGENEDGGK